MKNSAVAMGLEEISFHSNPQKKGNSKECSNYLTIALISNANKVMLKILLARLIKEKGEKIKSTKSEMKKKRVVIT